jgi:hypothetical protein
MSTTLGEEVVDYHLPLMTGDQVHMNAYIGGHLNIEYLEQIHCIYCGCLTSKSYSGGSCYSCLQKLPQMDMCQVKPELCHFDRGTCRDSAWGEEHCFQPHVVYLARSSSVKVGITREKPTERRWMDQGAVEGMIIASVPDRKTSGLIETALAQHIDDKTDFRKMLRGEISDTDLMEVYEDIVDHVPMSLQDHLVDDLSSVKIAYPLAEPPQKIKTVSLDKQKNVGGVLKGIKGQYLIFEDFVFNCRAHSGYDVSISGEKGEGYMPPKAENVDDEPLNLFDML